LPDLRPKHVGRVRQPGRASVRPSLRLRPDSVFWTGRSSAGLRRTGDDATTHGLRPVLQDSEPETPVRLLILSDFWEALGGGELVAAQLARALRERFEVAVL